MGKHSWWASHSHSQSHFSGSHWPHAALALGGPLRKCHVNERKVRGDPGWELSLSFCDPSHLLPISALRLPQVSRQGHCLGLQTSAEKGRHAHFGDDSQIQATCHLPLPRPSPLRITLTSQHQNNALLHLFWSGDLFPSF